MNKMVGCPTLCHMSWSTLLNCLNAYNVYIRRTFLSTNIQHCVLIKRLKLYMFRMNNFTTIDDHKKHNKYRISRLSRYSTLRLKRNMQVNVIQEAIERDQPGHRKRVMQMEARRVRSTILRLRRQHHGHSSGTSINRRASTSHSNVTLARTIASTSSTYLNIYMLTFISIKQ